VNCLESLYLAHEDRFLTYPGWDEYELYAAIRRKVAEPGLRAQFEV